MMLQKKSNPWMRGKALYILPVACIVLSAFATPELNEQIESAVETTTENRGKDTKLLEKRQASGTENVEKEVTDLKESDLISTVEVTTEDVMDGGQTTGNDSTKIVLEMCDKMPQYEGGMQNLMQYIGQNMHYPTVAMECGVTGRMIVQFVVNANGSVSEVKVVTNGAKANGEIKADPNQPADAVVTNYTKKDGNTQYLTKAEFNSSKKALAEEAVRVVKSTSGKWTPGEEKGKKGKCKIYYPYNIPSAVKSVTNTPIPQ